MLLRQYSVNLHLLVEFTDIKRTFQVSKKVYKKAVGDLYKRHLITVAPLSIRLVELGK